MERSGTADDGDRGLGLVGAVGALVGFYAAAVLVALGLLVVAVLMVATLPEHVPKLWIVAAAALLVAGFVVLWSILPRFDRFQPPGPELLETDAPLLFGELRELAAATDQAMPSHVYLCRDVNAFVTERGGIMGIGPRRVLGLGLPLLATLTVDEVRAVIAHELGHFHGGDTKVGPWLYHVRYGLLRTIANLHHTAKYVGEDFGPFAAVLGVVRIPFERFTAAFLRGTAGLSRAQEWRADALAVRHVGSEATAGALEKLEELSFPFLQFVSSHVEPLLERGRRPPIVEGFREYLALQAAAPSGADDLVIESVDEVDPYDTHPPLAERIARARERAVSPAEPDARPASVLVRDLDWVERKLLHHGRGVSDELEPVAWADAGEVHVAHWREVVAREARAMARVSMDRIPRGPAMREHEEARCGRRFAEVSDAMLVFRLGERWSAGIIVALVDLGWTLSVGLGGPVVLRWGELEFQPRRELAAWLCGDTPEEEWSARALQIGLAGVDLGASVQTMGASAS